MVQLNSSFDDGGPPFSKWRKGFGFGKVCRSYMNDPATVVYGRATPSGNNYYRENRLYKGKWEMDQISSMGCGERPDYGSSKGKCPVAPNEYGDVSKKLSVIKHDVVYKNLKMKPRFDSIETKIASNPRHSGPGPKYDTRYNAGDSGLNRGSKQPKWTLTGRCPDNATLIEASRKPGPQYNTRGKAGQNYPIIHGTLYDITMGGRFSSMDDMRQKAPGPGQYRVKSIFDIY